MVKAFFSVKTLRQLYKSLKEKYLVLLSRKGESTLSYKDKLFFEICCFALPLLDDYFDNNLYSIVNYQRFISIIEASCLMSLGEEKDYKSLNAPLFEDQYYILLNRTYSSFMPSFIESGELKKEYKKAKSEVIAAALKDPRCLKEFNENDLEYMRMPILLGRDLEESIRFYLGYIFIGVYKRSKEMVGLYDYRDIDDKYSLAFFNEVSRMLMKMNSEYRCSLSIKKMTIPSFEKESVVSAYKMEMQALDAIIGKIDIHYHQSFISKALRVFRGIDESMKNILINQEYQDISTLFKVDLEWMANVFSVCSYSSTLLNYNFNDKLDSANSEVRFNSFKKDLTAPNLLLFDYSPKEVIMNFISSSEPNMKKYCGFKKVDYLKLKYAEVHTACFGSGFLFDAPFKRFFAPDVDSFIIMHDLVKQVFTKIRDTLKDVVDISVEIEALFASLGKKDNLILSLYK